MLDSHPTRSDELQVLVATFQLDRFSVGRHTIRDERGWRVREFEVQSMWLATIEPSFDDSAYLMVVHTDAGPRALFCFRGENSLPIIHETPIEFPNFDDKVSASLKCVDLCPTDGNGCLDGIAYSLYVRTPDVSADLAFSNPKTASLRAVESAIHHVAEQYVRITERSDMHEYLKKWRRYRT